MPRILSTPLWLQKAGNAPEEYEDAFQPAKCGEVVGVRLRFAVADGATEGMLSGLWAQLLTQAFKRHWRQRDHASRWIARAYQDWVQVKQEYIARREAQNRPIQWYEEPGLEAGAFATLLGITLTGFQTGHTGLFEVIALGDSCVFQVRKEELVLQFPFKHSDEFNNRPLLLSSNPARNRRVLENLKSARGRFKAGDRFYLLTDALAAWFMRELESGNKPWKMLENSNVDAQAFAEWIETLRRDRQIRNDDVTCLRLKVI